MSDGDDDDDDDDGEQDAQRCGGLVSDHELYSSASATCSAQRPFCAPSPPSSAQSSNLFIMVGRNAGSPSDTACSQRDRVAFAQKPSRGLPASSSKNSESLYCPGEYLLNPGSYPRLTLDFHTNKRIIDEVVRIALAPRPHPQV